MVWTNDTLSWPQHFAVQKNSKFARKKKIFLGQARYRVSNSILYFFKQLLFCTWRRQQFNAITQKKKERKFNIILFRLLHPSRGNGLESKTQAESDRRLCLCPSVNQVCNSLSRKIFFSRCLTAHMVCASREGPRNLAFLRTVSTKTNTFACLMIIREKHILVIKG